MPPRAPRAEPEPLNILVLSPAKVQKGACTPSRVLGVAAIDLVTSHPAGLATQPELVRASSLCAVR